MICTKFTLPDWIDAEDWNLWLKTRKGRKMIPEQMHRQVAKLYAWKQQGLDYAKALQDSAINGWTGLFEPKLKIATTSDNAYEKTQAEMRARFAGTKPPTPEQMAEIRKRLFKVTT
jgi:hypothetical protein